jgi:hypothetical protein
MSVLTGRSSAQSPAPTPDDDLEQLAELLDLFPALAQLAQFGGSQGVHMPARHSTFCAKTEYVREFVDAETKPKRHADELHALYCVSGVAPIPIGRARGRGEQAHQLVVPQGIGADAG